MTERELELDRDGPRRPRPRGLASKESLRSILGEVSDLVRAKLGTSLNEHTRKFIELASFVCLGTSDGAGRCDVSPRGDPAGFVRILDDRTLFLPERPGNRLADSLRNILQNPSVGLWFVVPGVTETLRANGHATITDDPGLLSLCACEGKLPKLGLYVELEEVFTHCSKAFLRSDFWNPERFLSREALPSNGTILRALRGPEFDADGYDAERAARYARREGFY